jgi:hypothetical protein
MPPETNYSADSRDSFFVKHPITLAVVLACAIFGGVGAWFYYTNRPIPEDQSGVTQTQESPPHQPTQAEILKNYTAPASSTPIIIDKATLKNYTVPSNKKPITIDQKTLDSYSVPK